MKITRQIIGSGLVIALCLGICTGQLFSAPKKKRLTPPTADEIRKVTQAAPDKATAKPKKPRKLLVFSRSPGFKHKVIPITIASIRIMGKKTGAYETHVSNDIAMFEPNNLARFDAVVFNNTCGGRPDRELFLPDNFAKLGDAEKKTAIARRDMLRKSFANFVSRGGGLIGIHGASGAFFKWPEYGKMLGCYFKSHPWHEDVTINIEDPTHPLTADFKGKSFNIREEVYQFLRPYSRENFRALLTLDIKSVKNPSKGANKDGDYVLAWCKKYGKGRVFYSAFSHNNPSFWNPELLKFHLNGIQYALGDLAADDSPSGKKPPTPAGKVSAPPKDVVKSFNLDPFYKKHLSAGGIAVISSDKVSDYALLEAVYLIDNMLAGRGDICKALAAGKARMVIMGINEFTTDIPEHSSLKPSGFWDKRARGLGGQPHRPATSCGEENLLRYKGDPYISENILIHEFAHAIHHIGLASVDKTFDKRLKQAYTSAMKKGLWKGKYAAGNRAEYWAEAVQSWFDTNRKPDHDHNHVDTREELKEYDPGIAKLVAEVFGDKPWKYVRPSDRGTPGHLKGYDPSEAPRFSWPERVRKAWDEYKANKKRAGKKK
jgi:type 1 glutamine amidotransferase